MIVDEHVEALMEKYVENNSVVSLGTGGTNELFLKKLALYIEHNALSIKVVPTSHKIAELCSQFKIDTVALDDVEVDLAFDFVDQVDHEFNYISNETTSLIRDKMIAQDSAELVVVCDEREYVKKLTHSILAEVSSFAAKKTIFQLMNLGDAELLMNAGRPVMSETGHYFAEVQVDDIYSADDLEFEFKRIPGVLETSLFIGYADRVILHGRQLIVKSRLPISTTAQVPLA